jgi:OmpA-OmpF porin, OOP family
MKLKRFALVFISLVFMCLRLVAQEEETNEAAVQPVAKPTLQSSTQYDFVPGDKIIFYDDFSQEAIGDFPSMWTTNTSGEVRTIANYPGKWFYFASGSDVMCLMKNLNLPENFIFEFDLIAPAASEDNENCELTLTFFNSNEDYQNTEYVPGTMGFHLRMQNNDGWRVSGFADQEYINSGSESAVSPIPLNEPTHVIVWVQKRRIRVYHQGKKVLDGPTALPENSKFNRLRFWSGEYNHPFISNLKITTASPDMRNKLLTEGKLVTYGIYFDVNKDVVKPESYGTLKEIAKILNEVPDVKVKIAGHTDSDGADAANLDLSKRRAASVKNELVKNFNVNGDRLVTDGMGESQPVAPNDTPANKALNRRVEFIKM